MFDELDNHLYDLATSEGMAERLDTRDVCERIPNHERSETRAD